MRITLLLLFVLALGFWIAWVRAPQHTYKKIKHPLPAALSGGSAPRVRLPE